MPLKRLDDVFGPEAFKHAVFYHHEPALRFELAGEGTRLDRFSQAYDRARSVAARAFAGLESVTVVLASYMVGGNPRRTMLAATRACGVTVPARREYAISPPEDDSGDGLARSLVAFEVPVEAVPRLLWGVITRDLGIRPRLVGDLYLAAPARGVLLHPYDDRGLDVIGPNSSLLSELYREFHGWLLAHDLKRMESFFGGR